MDFENGQIKVFFGPKGHKAPDDLEKVIVDFIDEAEESLEVAVQELDNPLIAAALERASRRHKTSKPDRRISVRIVVEANYLRESSPIPPPDPNDPNSEEKPGQFEENREKMRQLLRSAAHFKLDFNASTFHQKFIVRDYNRPKAALLTGSTNFTTTGTRSNLNNLVIFHHPDIVKAYHSEWNQRQHREGPNKSQGKSGTENPCPKLSDQSPNLKCAHQRQQANSDDIQQNKSGIEISKQFVISRGTT